MRESQGNPKSLREWIEMISLETTVFNFFFVLDCEQQLKREQRMHA